MNMTKILLPVMISLAMAGCGFAEGTEANTVSYIIVRMVSRSPTSPVLGYVDAKACEMGKVYANDTLDIHDIPAYQVGSERLTDMKRIVENAPDRDVRKTPPYFVVEIGSPQFPVAAYSMSRETLSETIPLMPSDVRKFLQLMYDSSAP